MALIVMTDGKVEPCLHWFLEHYVTSEGACEAVTCSLFCILLNINVKIGDIYQ